VKIPRITLVMAGGPDPGRSLPATSLLLYGFTFGVVGNAWLLFITSLAGAVAKYCDEHVCPWVCLCVCLSLRQDVARTTRAIVTKFLYVLPVSVARSSSDTFTIGRIACRREGVFFPIENALSAGKGDGSVQRGRSMLSTIALFSWCPATDKTH